MTPIPAKAQAGDPRWAVAFLQLAEGLVGEGAKAKLVERFTDLPHSRVQALYRSFAGKSPPAGPIVQGSARAFAVPGKHTPEALRIHCAIFLACYERIGAITADPLHRGWQLLAAFRSYRAMIAPLGTTAGTRRLDINQAYALLTVAGFLQQPERSELQRARCRECGVAYPVAASAPQVKQGCPVCAIHANCVRLARQGTTTSALRA
jgi:hypothetical protein